MFQGSPALEIAALVVGATTVLGYGAFFFVRFYRTSKDRQYLLKLNDSAEESRQLLVLMATDPTIGAVHIISQQISIAEEMLKTLRQIRTPKAYQIALPLFLSAQIEASRRMMRRLEIEAEYLNNPSPTDQRYGLLVQIKKTAKRLQGLTHLCERLSRLAGIAQPDTD